MSIRVFYDEISFRVEAWRKKVKLFKAIISSESKSAGDISFVLTDDDSLREINIEFLEHDYYTDVITFNYNEGSIINGEIYISLDRVRENAFSYNVSLESELSRVLIHGVLHLVGYDDKNEEEKSEIRRKEDFWLKSL